MSDDTKQKINDFSTWAMRTMAGALLGIVAFYTSQLNTSIGVLNVTLRAIEQRQNESDKKILAIEISREIGMQTYKKLLEDFDAIKLQVNTNTLQIGEIRRVRGN